MFKLRCSLLIILYCSCGFVAISQARPDLKYYLPEGVLYKSSVPVPAAVIGHEVGEWHVTHDKLVLYMRALAAANPERIKLQETGKTYEGRQQLILVITSPENHKRLEDIRKQHLQLCDPGVSANLDLTKMPAVVLMGYSIHGNESSGANAALLAGYYLAAAQSNDLDRILENTVILLDPSFNPDGLQRFSTWANQHKSKHLVGDPNSREFNEVWPGGRFNHYWFDLNRDWLPAVHAESRNRLKYFHDWRPNVVTDHHEMGTNSTFFFQPGVPSRVNPLTPAGNQELTSKIATYHAKYLDKIGSLYFTKEAYDDFYYGKGSTFPDIHGAVGILFEQASSRGHVQESVNGLLTFPFTIRNQFYTTLSTIEAVSNLRLELLGFQRESFRTALEEAKQSPVKGYIFGDRHNPFNADILAEMLQLHRVDVRLLNADHTDGKITFESGKAYFVPTSQPQYRLVRTIFEKVGTFSDSLFYDVTSWTMPLALGVSYSEARSIPPAKSLSAINPGKGMLNASPQDYAWLLDWRDFEAPAALHVLQSGNIISKVATRGFTQTIRGKQVFFPAGTIVIPRQLQSVEPEKIFSELQAIASSFRVNITGVSSGLSHSGIDLGSGEFSPLNKPRIAMLVGTGISATDAGEVWHLMDQRMGIPATHLEISTFNRIDLSRYNTLIMVSGAQTGLNKEKLKAWIQGGGLLIACEDAVEWCVRNGISKLKFRQVSESIDSSKMIPYADRKEIAGAQKMSGAIFRAEADLSHPLCFGYTNPFIDLFKSNGVFIEAMANPYSAPVRYGTNPLQSGFITSQNYTALKGTASVLVQSVGQGKVIHFADNPNFRAFWLGSMRLFLNAIFLGRTIDSAPSPADD